MVPDKLYTQMKITLKNPLCISRLNNRQPSTATKKENHQLPLNELQLSDLSTQNNYSQQLTIASHISHNSERKYFKNKQNQIYSQTLTLKPHTVTIPDQRIQQLETQNRKLKLQNAQLFQKMMQEEGEKTLLKDKIDKFEQNLQALQTEFQQQFKKLPSNEKNTGHKTIVIKQKSCQMKREPSKPHIENRRMSMQEQVFDLTTKVKEYRNQLEVERIRRVNLQRELQINRENARIEMKMEMESMNKKVEGMRELLERKNQQIREKEDLIKTFIR